MKTRIRNACIFALIASVILEVFVFNFNSWASLLYRENCIEPYVYWNEGFTVAEGSHAVLPEGIEECEFLLYNFEGEYRNVYVDFHIEGENQTVETEYYLIDEGHSSYYYGDLYKGTLWNESSASSRFADIDPSGKVSRILIKIHKAANEKITIDQVLLNRRRPLFFSASRMAVVFFVSLFFFLLSQKRTPLSTYDDLQDRTKKMILAGMIVLQLLVSVFVCSINPHLQSTNEHYRLLTEALAAGEVSINYPVDEKLAELDNPYDVQQRTENGADVFWDAAYYKGKYYIYFGVVPALLFYLPYYLITGTHLADPFISAFCFFLFSVSLILLAYRCYGKHFRKLPFIIFVLLSLSLIYSSGALTLLAEPRVYNIPIISALSFAVTGLCLWMYSVREDNTLNKVFVFLGSLSMALVAGCRPQLIVFAFAAFLIFFDQLKDLKHHLPDLACAAVPFMIVAAGLMAYNHARFGSPFDFGANYNVTFNDMTVRGFHFNRIFSSLYYYLFQFPNISPQFPFLQQTSLTLSYIGVTTHEFSFGGLFFIAPFTLFSLFVWYFRKAFPNKRLFYASVMCLLMGVLLCIVDGQMAGMVERYFSDFSLLFLISASLVFASVYTKEDETDRDLLRVLLFILILIGLTTGFLRIFAEDYCYLRSTNPFLYYRIRELFMFWL